MSYLKRPDLHPAPDAAMPGASAVVVQLDSGELVRVDVAIKASADTSPVVHVRARMVELGLDPVITARGRLIEVDFKHNIASSTLPLADIVRECALLVLGEPLTPVELLVPDPLPEGRTAADYVTTLIPWSLAVVQSRDIRRAIAASTETVNLAEVL